MTPFETARPQDKVVILKRVPVFASCTDEQLALIADRTRLIEYKKGESVYQEGDAAEAFYIISSGRLRVFSRAEQKTFTILHNGDSFGEISLLTGETHSATVEALNDTLLLQLEKKDFDEVINRIPSLVLYLSRTLSKRLRARNVHGEFSEATIVAVNSAVRGVGQTCFTFALAASLKRETGSEVVVVDLSSTQEEQAWFYGPGASAAEPQRLTITGAEEPFNAVISDHPMGFSVLPAGALLRAAGQEQMIAPLLSALTNRFAYILIELPAEVKAPVLKALVQADLIYFITDSHREHVLRLGVLLRQLRSSMGALEQRIKLVLNQVKHGGEALSAADIEQQLGHPVAYLLPHVQTETGRLSTQDLARLLDRRESLYAVTVRHLARELGGLLVGLALGSGAALGLSHIGILKVIEREKIPIDIIAGSSIGALIAGLWASGKSASELERMAMEFKNPWDIRQLFMLDLGIPVITVVVGVIAGLAVGWATDLFAGLLFAFIVIVLLGLALGPLVGGPIQGARLMQKLEADFGGKRFEDTWLPLRIIAANPMGREEVVFASGSIAEAVRASVSIPGIFKPITLQGKLCLDGGVVSPVPVGVLKRAGAHHVIAVNVFPTTPELIEYRERRMRTRADRDAQLAARSLPVRLLWRLRQEIIRSMSPLVFDVIMRSMQAMEFQIAEVACREADITLRPTLPGSHWLEFFSPEKFIRRGEEVALEYLPELQRIARGRHIDKASSERVG